MTDNSSIDSSVTGVWQVWQAFRRNKKRSRAIDEFESELETNLFNLARDLQTGQYHHGSYMHKIVHEKKRRDIYVASVRDRVVHRIVYDHLMPIVNPRLDDDVWSCRPGKGLHGALQRTQQLSYRYAGMWVYRADVRKFFDYVDHRVLRQSIRRYVDDEKVLWLVDEILASYTVGSERRYGMPIGNLTSQLFANIYLNEFDRFVRHTIKPFGYVRYGDDFVMYLATEQQAKNSELLIGDYMHSELLLEVHPTNNYVLKVGWGLHFLGHIIYPEAIMAASNRMRKIVREFSVREIDSYNAQMVPKWLRRDLPWLLQKHLRAPFE